MKVIYLSLEGFMKYVTYGLAGLLWGLGLIFIVGSQDKSAV